MDHIRSLLPKVLSKRGLKKHASAALVCWKADEWISKNLASSRDLLRATRFTEGELCIESANSLAAQECQQASASILAYLQTECPETGILSVRVLRQK